jgi:hypothetical protein
MDPLTAFEWWARAVARNGVSRPEARTGFLVSHNKALRNDLKQSLPGVTEDLV